MTGLTIPKAATAQGIAGQNPGRPFQAQPVVASQAGSALAEFGATVAEFGGRLESDRRARARDRAEIEAAKGLTDLRAEVQQIEDPYEAELAWNQGTEALRTGIAQRGDDSPALRLTDPDQEDFNLAFLRLRQQHDAVLSPRFVSERMRAHHADIEDMGATLTASWVSGDRAARDETEAYFIDFLDRQVQRGVLTADEAEARELAWHDGLTRAEQAHAEALDRAEAEAENQPDPAVELAERLDAEPDLARLASARRYVPLSRTDIEDMAALVARADELPPRERADFIAAEIETAQRARLRALPRPRFAPAGPIEAQGIVQAARRLKAARQSGAISDADFIRQAELLQEYQELMNG